MIFTCKDFVGHYPVGAAAVVVADTEQAARELLVAALMREGLPQDADKLTLSPLVPDVSQVRILVNGDY